MSVREIKTDEFDRALQADKTVLVDFYADGVLHNAVSSS